MRRLLQQTFSKAHQTVGGFLPEELKQTLWLQAFGLTKVPMLFFCAPRVVQVTADRCVLKVPLNRRTKNHVGSMYFGAMCCGADLAGGILAVRWARENRVSAPPVFKEVKAAFLKRAEGDVFFTCEQGAYIARHLENALRDGTRANLPVEVIATCPEKCGDEPVARFTMVLSVRPKVLA